MYILGINSVYHESSAAILKDGKLLAAVEEERFNRIKHAKAAEVDTPDQLPFASIDFCLREAGISFREVDHVAYSFQPHKRWKHYWVGTDTRKNSWGTKEGEKVFYEKTLSTKKILEKHYDSSLAGKYHWVDHHLSHAGGAFFVSPFDKSLILIIDGIGENASCWIGYGEGNRMKKIDEVLLPNSLGFLWEKFSQYLGFSEYDAGKVMGLSSYGDWKVYWEEFHKLVSFSEDGLFTTDDSILKFRVHNFQRLESIFGVKKRKEDEEITKQHEHIAAGLQKISEKVVLRLVKHALNKHPSKHLCLSGGVSLNCVANQEVFYKLPLEHVYVPPATHDGGNSIGAAFYVWNQKLGKNRGFVLDDPYLGPQYDEDEIKHALDAEGVRYQKVPNIERRVARLIAAGHIVAWFQGRMEIGPRALGNRSILADPRRAEVREQINLQVKKREYFRPFAPSVLEERAADWFYIRKVLLSDRFMLFAPATTYPEKIPAVTHVDETSRIQCVNKKINPRYHRLISEFEKITGVPIVLNTSFNIQEPIVCTPQDAVKTFLRSKIDYLAIGDYLAKHKN